jgi:hypothetical protein
LKVDVIAEMLPYAESLALRGIEPAPTSLEQQIECLIGSGRLRKAREIAMEFGIEAAFGARLQIAAVAPQAVHDARRARAAVGSCESEVIAELRRAGDGLVGEVAAVFKRLRSRVAEVTPAVMALVMEMALNSIAKVTVDSIESEFDAMIAISQIAHLVLFFKLQMPNLTESAQFELACTQLQIIRRFVKFGIFGRYGHPYSLAGFTSQDAARSFVTLLQQYDRSSLKLDFQRVWSISSRAHQQAINCFRLGLLQAGLDELRTACHTLKLLKLDTRHLAAELEAVLCHPTIIDVTSIASGEQKIALVTDRFDDLVNDIRNNRVTFPSLHNDLRRRGENYDIVVSSPRVSAFEAALGVGVGVDFS